MTTPNEQRNLDSLREDDPNRYSPLTSTSRYASFTYAVEGWVYMLRYQRNIWIIAPASVVVALVGWWLGISRVEWAILTIMITMVWMAEFINAAIEAIFNLVSPEWHPMAKVGKDVAAATVLLSVIASVIVGLILFAPPLWDKLIG